MSDKIYYMKDSNSKLSYQKFLVDGQKWAWSIRKSKICRSVGANRSSGASLLQRKVFFANVKGYLEGIMKTSVIIPLHGNINSLEFQNRFRLTEKSKDWKRTQSTNTFPLQHQTRRLRYPLQLLMSGDPAKATPHSQQGSALLLCLGDPGSWQRAWELQARRSERLFMVEVTLADICYCTASHLIRDS